MKLIFWRLLPHGSGADAECVHEIECDTYIETPLGVQLFRWVEPKPIPAPEPGAITATPFRPRRPNWWERLFRLETFDEEDTKQFQERLRRIRVDWALPDRRHFMTIRASAFHYYEIEQTERGSEQ